jgi:hypothetical protein
MLQKDEYLKIGFEKYKDSLNYLDLVASCLSQNSTQRPSASEILMKLKGISYQNAIPLDLINDTISDPSQSSVEPESDDENAAEFLNSFSKEENIETSISRNQEGENLSIPEKNIEDISPQIHVKSSIQSSNEILDFPIQRINFQNSFSSIYHFENTKKIYHHREVIKWSVERVLKWLDEIDLGDYKSAFQYNEIHGENLLELHDIHELKSFLGIKKLGHLKTLQKYIQLMREGE